MAEKQKNKKWSTLKTILIVVLIVIIILLLYSSRIDLPTKNRFWLTLGAVTIVGIIIYFVYFKKQNPNLYNIIEYLLHTEKTKFLNDIDVDIRDVEFDELDPDTFAFSFDSVGELITYKWDVSRRRPKARLFKTLEEVKDEIGRRGIYQLLAQENIKKAEKRRLEEEEGMDDDSG